ncbi:restriction endonuclease subunit S [Megasphaera elsdenii]|uniref:restriction endonuclease subunit S n=1 Tax=Megasphaera elsdenii TaxID=907 RepID=UPI001958FBFB|nr:restriction endonuclease subunit S [Megasphaera elsdenii]MBM6702528.1 restriction endonuclease subunit S [Megasphaera elsdenii]
MKYKLSDICKYAKGKIKVSALDDNTYISTENMLPNKGGITKAVSLPTQEQTQAFMKNDVLVSNIRPYFKKIWYATFDGGCSNDVLVFRAKDGVSSRFLHYVLADDTFFDYSMATSKGTKMPRGDKKAIMEYEVPELSYEDQCRIAGILEVIDEKIELNTDINKNLEQQAKALYKDWFFDFSPFSTEGNLPNGWRLGTVGDIIQLHDSKRVPLSGSERGKMKKIYPYYGATSLMDYVDNYLFDGIYLLLGEDGTVVDSLGFPILQYIYGQFWVNNHAHIITGKEGFSVEELYLFFSLTNIKSIVTGAVQQKVSQQNLKKVPAIIPNKEALNAFDDLIQPIFAQIRNLKDENIRLADLRDSLLPRLMSGELDVSNVEI